MATMNGWPAVGESAVVRIFVGGDADGATVLAGDVATAFRWLLEQFHARVEPIKEVNGWRSAAFNKHIGGAARSNHISGTAVDVNGARHPFEHHHPGKRYSSGFTNAQARTVRAILKESGGLFAWGLDFPVGRRDAMHFELAGGTTRTDVARFVATLSEEDDMPYSEDHLRRIIREEVAAVADDPTGKVAQIHARTQKYLDHKVSEIPAKVWAWVDKTKKHVSTPYERLVELWTSRPAARVGDDAQ